jgi:hypothetical protein
VEALKMSTANARTATGGVPPGWETRIYSGVQVAEVSLESRSALASALGEAGVEAEYFLSLLAAFPDPDLPTGEATERLYDALEAWAARLVAVAASLEVATQGYLGELDGLYPTLRDEAGSVSDVWWSPFAGHVRAGEPLAIRLRRRGQSYRAVVESRLPALIEGICEQMALLLHALSSLPPAGVAPARALYGGLNEITLALQADVVPRRVRDLSQDYPGLVTVIARLRARLSAPAPIEDDIAWAREQLAEFRAAQPVESRGLGARLFGGFGRKGSAKRSNDGATREWEGVVAALVGLRRASTR